MQHRHGKTAGWLCLAAACFLLLATPGRAAIFFVTNADDDGAGSLRQALADAAAAAGADEIRFDTNAFPGLDGGTIQLTSDSLNAIDTDPGGVTINADLLPHGITIVAPTGNRALVNTGILGLYGVTISGGDLGSDFGGGAIYSSGDLQLWRCTLTGNHAGYGGALFNDGAVRMYYSTICSNTADTASAIYNRGGATTEIHNSTIAKNHSATGYSIYVDNSLTLTSCTVAGNTSDGDYGGIYVSATGNLGVLNSIVGGEFGGVDTGLTDILNSGQTDFYGENISLKAPISMDTGFVVDNTTNPDMGFGTNIIAAPLLADLASNGGRTLTLLPLAGSPAIDAAPDSSESFDQRGAPRPLNGIEGGSAVGDIGAVEVGIPDLSAITLSVGALTPTFARTTTSYTVSLPYEADRIEIVGTAVMSGGTVSVNGHVVNSGAVANVPLAVGNNVISVVGVGDGFLTKTYTLTVTRAALVTHLVTNNNDSGAGSLRQTIIDAQSAGAGSQGVIFDAGLSGATITLSGGRLVASNVAGVFLTIDASSLSAGLTITGNNADRVFENHGVLYLRGMTITGGSSDANGGGILNDGALTLDRCTLSENAAFAGGAIASTAGSVTLRNSTVANNSGGDSAGAIINTGALTLIHSTIAFNSQGSGAAVVNSSGTLTLDNSIVSNNESDVDNEGDLVRVGFNLSPVMFSMVDGTGDGVIYDYDPLLTTLGNYGGSTKTCLPQSGSPAIDSAFASYETVDQRGFTRPADSDGNGEATSDIGAVETRDVTLSGLTTSLGTLNPVFNKSTGAYLVVVSKDAASITVTPTVTESASTITVNDAPLASGIESDSIPLDVGLTTVTIVVAAAEGGSRTYTLTVSRGSNNADLSSLGISAGAIGFSSDTTGYTTYLLYTTTNVTVTPTSSDANSTFTVNGTALASGATSGAIALGEGATSVAIVVTAENTVTTKTYFINFIRPYRVTSTADSGPGSLRQAVLDAYNSPNDDSVYFDPALNGQTITLTTGVLNVHDTLVIDSDGLPNGLTINGNSASQIFLNNGTLTLRGLTLTGGGTGVSTTTGGAIRSAGNLTLDRCTFTGNSARFGAAVHTTSNATIQNCTFTGNTATDDGTIYNAGVLTMTHSTLAGNSCATGAGEVANSYVAFLRNCILAGSVGSGIDLRTTGLFTVLNGANIIQSIVNSGGGSLFGTPLNVDPLLGALADNGGPTKTMRLQAGSPAIDAADTAYALSIDQRGLPRPFDGDGNGSALSDIGAFEWIKPIARTDTITRLSTTKVAKVLLSTLIANDSDPDGDPLSITTVSFAQPAGASVQISGNFVIYTAPSTNAGNGSFKYTVSAGGKTTTCIVTVLQVAPTIESTAPASIDIAIDGLDRVVKFIGVPGRPYKVQYKTDIADPWSDFTSSAVVTAPDGGVFTYRDVNPGGSQRFYRVIPN